MCNEQGGVIDDLIVYRVAADHYNIVLNASNREKDIVWMQEHLPKGLTFEDMTRETSLIAFQGPRAAELLPADGSTDDIGYFTFRNGKVAGRPALLSRTGYTGEDGFELFVGAQVVGEVWDAILETGRSQGVLPAGLGARDATRLEAGLRLWGNDMDETVNAYEAGLGWTVKLDKGDFTGRDALAAVKEKGPRRRLVGLTLEPASIPRHGSAVIAAGKQVGTVTSGTHSFFLGHPIALAMVEGREFRVGDTLGVDVRGREAPARIVKLPFYRGSARVK
jgi:aminomethyltransferase